MLAPSLFSMISLVGLLLPGVVWLLEKWLGYLCFLGDLGDNLVSLVTGVLPLPFLSGFLLAWIGCILWYHRGGRT